MRPRLGHVLVLGALLFALAAAGGAQDFSAPLDSDARIVRLSYVDGSVQMDREDLGSSAAFLNSPVTGGSRLLTGSDGFAEVEFETGGTLRLTPNTDVHFRQLGLRDGHKVSVIEMADGTGYFNIRKDSDDDFRVLLGGNELRVPRSSRFRIHLQPQSAQIAVMKGEVQLVGSDGNVKIKKDEQLLLDFQDPGRYFLGRRIDALEYDSWDHDRDDYRDRYVNASNSYSGYSSSYLYGVSDLNYYGNYVLVPGYGYAWRPYGYDVSWDPFMDGAWVWYPGWGYMWVSSYPWGWMPYRYGRWIWVPGYGWMWQPGHSWNRWYVCNTVYNPPSYYHPPHRPNTPVVVGHQVGGGQAPPPVVVGKFPTGDDRRRFLNADGGDTRMRGGQPDVVARTPVRTPPVITPGVQPPKAVDELRRVHGDNLGVHGNAGLRGWSTGPTPAAASTTSTPTGKSPVPGAAPPASDASSSAWGNGNSGATPITGAGNARPSPRVVPVTPIPQRVERDDSPTPRSTPAQNIDPQPRQDRPAYTPPARTSPPPAPSSPSSSYRSSGGSYAPSSGAAGSSAHSSAGSSAASSTRTSSAGATSTPHSSAGAHSSGSNKDPK